MCVKYPNVFKLEKFIQQINAQQYLKDKGDNKYPVSDILTRDKPEMIIKSEHELISMWNEDKVL